MAPDALGGQTVSPVHCLQLEAYHEVVGIAVWLAIDDADAANSAMQVIPGSHAGYREYATFASSSDDMLSRQEMPTGALSVHDSFLLHGSGSNRTSRRRAGYAIRVC